MIFTNYQLDKIIKPALQELAKKEMPISLAFKFRRLLKLVGNELDTLNQMTMEIIQKHGETDEANEIYRELLKQTIEIDAEKIKLDELENLESISPSHLIAIQDFIEE